MGPYGSENYKTLLLLQTAAESFQAFPEFSPNSPHKTTFGIFEILKIEFVRIVCGNWPSSSSRPLGLLFISFNTWGYHLRSSGLTAYTRAPERIIRDVRKWLAFSLSFSLSTEIRCLGWKIRLWLSAEFVLSYICYRICLGLGWGILYIVGMLKQGMLRNPQFQVEHASQGNFLYLFFFSQTVNYCTSCLIHSYGDYCQIIMYLCTLPKPPSGPKNKSACAWLKWNSS